MSRAYGECARSGKRVPIDQLVEDGQMKGMKVARDWYDPRHPQLDQPQLTRERHKVIAPELSKPAGEGTPAPALTFDETGKPVFV